MKKMKHVIVPVSFIVVSTLGFLATGCSDSAMSRRDAKPEFSERLKNEAIKGRVTKAEGDYLWIREDDGKEIKVHVDDRTKMDKVVPGDRAKAYITDSGHATTIQRVD